MMDSGTGREHRKWNRNISQCQKPNRAKQAQTIHKPGEHVKVAEEPTGTVPEGQAQTHDQPNEAVEGYGPKYRTREGRWLMQPERVSLQ